jgi:MYXO-CTERM domain-containing protein
MRRLLLWLGAAAVAGLLAVPAAAADGPLYVVQGGGGVASHSHPGLHYVTISDGASGTLLETIDAAHGRVFAWTRLPGSWGIPTIGNGYLTGQGLSRDGRTLVLAPTGGPFATPSKFLVVDTRRMRAVRTITLHGSFTFDALSPDASRMYLIQYRYASSGDVSDYIVRGFDMRTNRLLPGKIADRREHEESMSGYAMTRTTSADGRWVYTLYQKPNGEPFVHALDTVRGAAYCVDLPKNKGLYNIALSLRDGGRTLAADWRSGRPWLNVAVGTWRVSFPSSGFPWAWVGTGIGGGLALLAAGALVLRRRRSEEVHEHAGQELGLA